MPKKVLVIGATRGIGLATLKACLTEGYHVRGFARSASQIPIDDERLEKFAGDALSSHSIARALQDVEVVIQALGIPVNTRMLTGPIELFSKSTRLLVPAMEEAGVRRLIAVTGFGAGDGRNRISPLQRVGFELFLGRAYSDKDIQEDVIKSSSLDWTIVRPGILTSAQASGTYRVLEDPTSWRNGFVSRADVADFLVKQIPSSTYVSKTPVLIGRCGLPNL